MNKKARLAGVGAAAIGLAAPMPASSLSGYVSGDFHNHTTCSDGSTSVETLTRESLTYLDWFIQAGHSGSYNRDCRYDDFDGTRPDGTGGRPDGVGEPFDQDGNPIDGTAYWEDTIGAENIKGDSAGGSPKRMWRWQSLQELNFDQNRDEGIAAGKPAFLGLEWVVPGHEHSSNSIIAGQYLVEPNVDALAQFEYCFAAPSNDTSGGGGQGWTCEISAESNAWLISRFGSDPAQGTADYNGTLGATGVNVDDTGEHVKSTAAMFWMQENFAGQSYAAPAHVERQGAFIPDDNEGFNVEHIRDWNTAAPDIAFGFESQPGHQAQYERGSYNAGRPTSGLYTWGGTGCYGAAEAALPGKDFEGNDLTQADFGEAGRYPEIDDDQDPAKVTLCRAGVRTMWDALLSEGRRFWFFASSDWHNRGSFGPFEPESTNDFWPGEFQKTYAYVKPRNPDEPSQDIVDGLRSGNVFTVQGDLIDSIRLRACRASSPSTCATMGGELTVAPGEDVLITLYVRDPSGTNHSPYSFNNPSLLQVGIEQPVNEPKLAHVELITGKVTGPIAAANCGEDPSADYCNPLAPETTRIAKQWVDGDWSGRGTWKRMRYTIEGIDSDMYVRARGSNIPPGTPNERDADGNPLSDKLSDNIPCGDPACPAHVSGLLTADLEAWADIWFHANPIFIKVEGALEVAGDI
jgi:hypothetical protein